MNVVFIYKCYGVKYSVVLCDYGGFVGYDCWYG